MVLVSPTDGRILRDLVAVAAARLESVGNPRFSRDGQALYMFGKSRDGRDGVWIVPTAGGPPRLVVAFDDVSLSDRLRFISVGRDRLYLTVSEYESDIWVATLKY